MPALGDPRHVGAALATCIVITLAGVLAFHDSSRAAMQGMALVGFFSAFAVFHFLDERARRRKKDGVQ
jgi:hypothetical protein